MSFAKRQPFSSCHISRNVYYIYGIPGPSDAYGDRGLGNNGSGTGLSPDGTKPVPEPMLTYYQWSSVSFTEDQFHRECLRH